MGIRPKQGFSNSVGGGIQRQRPGASASSTSRTAGGGQGLAWGVSSSWAVARTSLLHKFLLAVFEGLFLLRRRDLDSFVDFLGNSCTPKLREFVPRRAEEGGGGRDGALFSKRRPCRSAPSGLGGHLGVEDKEGEIENFTDRSPVD